jgi:hypothetical protein
MAIGGGAITSKIKIKKPKLTLWMKVNLCTMKVLHK